MKKKLKWISCASALLTLTTAVMRHRRKEALYKLTFSLEDKDTGAQRLSAGEASEKIVGIIRKAGYPYAEYVQIAAGAKETADSLHFFVTMAEEQQVMSLFETVQTELNLATSGYTKEERKF